jgi:UDP-glucose 4-epimerase
MRVLVTGGAGFIGSNLVDALVASGHEPGVVDDLSTGTTDNLQHDVWFRRLDILDERLPSTVAEFAPEVVVHLAAQASVVVSLEEPERDWAVNAEGTRIVASAAAATGSKRVISASSAAVYGEPAELPLLETSSKEPINPYGRSKLAAEELLAQELVPSGVDFASFRFANVYGPRQDWQGEGGVVAVFCGMLAEGRVPTIHGTGEQTRDFVFVGDVVGAILAALTTEARLSDPAIDVTGGPAYNISTGRPTSVSELAAAAAGVAGFAGSFQHSAAREGDIEHSVLDPGKARSVFGWDARIPLERGLEPTYEWFAAPRG